MTVSEKPWDGSAGRFTPEQWRSSCILHLADDLNKSNHKLPIKEPGGALSRAGVHAAASRFGSVQAPSEAKARAKASLRGAYKTLSEEPPDNVKAALDWQGSHEQREWMADTGLLPDHEGEAMATTTPPKKKQVEPPYDPTLDEPNPERQDPPSDQVPDGEKIPEKDKRKVVRMNDGNLVPIPFHTVLAPEGVWSGDKRRFGKGSLSNRPTPLPFTWQKTSASGHDGNVVVAKIEAIGKYENLQVGAGHILMSVPEADQFVGMLAEFGRFGVSVDADKVAFDLDENNEEGVTFSEARTSSACAVSIPAFSEAYIALGEAPEEWGLGEVEETPDEALVPALVASGVNMSTELLEQLRRGPGWVTNPEATRRIHAYWTTPGEPGFEKIGWGTDGDYSRCINEIGQEIAEKSADKLRFMHQICAQWQHDAIGIWPGKGEKAAADTLELSDTEMAEGVHLVAGAAKKAPADWFRMEPRSTVCPITVEDSGQVYGYIAAFGTCHIGFDKVCVTPPENDDFTWFHGAGQVPLDDGTRANTGVISIGGGHAGPHATLRAAIAHYDSTSTAVADVTARNVPGKGIWVCGRVRPGATDEQVSALMASKVSGDWRTYDGQMTLCAVLAVNVAGFPVPRVAASNGHQESLVAAGVVVEEDIEQPTFNASEIGRLIAEELAAIEERREQMAAVAARVSGA